MDKKPGQPRKYDELLSCEVRVYFTRSQFDELLTASSTMGAGVYLRELFIAQSSNNNPLIKAGDRMDNGDG